MRARPMAILLAALLLAGCPKPPTFSPLTPATRQDLPVAGRLPEGALAGQVDLAAFKVQATIAEVAEGATIALIDSATGHTLGTTVSDANGRFVLTFGNGFTPIPDHVYYLEALKGLKAGTALPNRIGSPLARVRTLVAHNGGWVSANSGVPDTSISITSTTTALCIIASLRAATTRPVPMPELIGSLPVANDPASFTKAGASGITLASLAQVVNYVKFALQDRDQDPFRSVLLDVSDPGYDTFVLPNMPFTVTYLAPPSAAIGEDLEVAGDSFDPVAANNLVTFTGSGGTRIGAPVQSVSSDRTRLRVKVPSGAANGLLSVQVGNLLLNSPTAFQLASRDGHRIVDDDGNLYVANSAYGTVSKISPQGVTTRLITDLDTPLRGITLSPDGTTLYVISGDAIRNYSTSGTLLGTPLSSGATGAWGLAFSQAGDLFVSKESTHQICKVSAGSLLPVSNSALLANPRGISFGPDRQLYVANFGNDTVVSVDPDSGATALFKSGFSQPWSLAFDTFGAMYVTNNAGNSVYRVGTDGVIRPFASVRSPGGIDSDPSGYLYVADNSSNRIYRIDTSGLSYVLAEGISYPKGIAADAAGNFYVANSSNHTVIRITPDGTVTTVARGFNDPSGVALDEARNHLYVSDVGDGSVNRIDLADGSFSTVLRNLTSPSGIAYDSASNSLYVYQPTSSDGATTYSYQPEVQEYSVLTAPYALTGKLRSGLRNNHGIAFDAGANALYVTLPLENAVTRIDRATGLIRRVATTAPAPEDIAVDGSGKVYVACKGTSGSDDAIQVFAWNAADRVLDLTASLTDPAVDRPTTIAFDGSAIYVGNSGTGASNAGSVKRLDPATHALSAVISNVTTPTGLAFSGSAGVLWVAGGGKVARVDGYATAPAMGTGFNWGGVYDVGATADGATVYVMTEGGVYSTTAAGTPYSTVARDWHRGARRWTPDGAGQYFVTSNGAAIYQTALGSGGNGRSCRYLGWSNIDMLGLYWQPTISVGSKDGNRWLVVPRGGSWDGAISRLNLVTKEEYCAIVGWDYDTSHGTAFDPGTGKAWAVSYNNARAQRVNGAHTGYELNAALDASYQGFGAVFSGNFFYATISSHHRIDRYSPTDTNGASRTTPAFGLGAPEL